MFKISFYKFFLFITIIIFNLNTFVLAAKKADSDDFETDGLTHAYWNQFLLKSDDHLVFDKIDTYNYLLDEDGNPREYVKDYAEYVLSRSPEKQFKLNELLTVEHGQTYGMNFMKKSRESFKYFNPPINGLVVPILKSHFDILVKSTGPVLRAFRVLLQRLFSLPEGSKPTAQNLGLATLPAKVQKEIISVLTSSIYYSKHFSDPNLSTYPFLSVTGFDASISNPVKPDVTFYELNTGTPSGISNNIQLLDVLRKVDPEAYEKIEKDIVSDRTFKLLAQTIRDNTLSWTGKNDGICVIVGPGQFSGAHPDVASIAKFSGLPLVRIEDLYPDDFGNIRLMEKGEKREIDPIVRGIYNRSEVSCLLQSSELGLPMVSPRYKGNKKIASDLKPGVIYKYVYEDPDDLTSEIVGVERDSMGRPKIQKFIGKVDGAYFLRAIKSKKLYLSNYAARTVDDKKLFQLVAKYLATKYLRSDDKYVARPPKTLELNEYKEFYQASDERLKNYVIKVTDSSGGDGVHLLVNLPAEERKEKMEMVKKDPEKYIIQQFKNVAVMSHAIYVGSGDYKYVSQSQDLRIFIFMDGKRGLEASVYADPQSVLLRTAQFGMAKTNTSAGGGYGIAVVVDDKKNIIPSGQVIGHTGNSTKLMMMSFMRNLKMIRESLDKEEEVSHELLEEIMVQQRSLMDIFDRELRAFSVSVQDYREGRMADDDFRDEVENFIRKLSSKERNFSNRIIKKYFPNDIQQ